MKTEPDIINSLDAVRPATVAGFTDTGACNVRIRGSDSLLACEILQTAERFPLCLVEGDRVLVVLLPGDLNIILGRIGPAQAGERGAPPEHLVLDATKSLTLQCGEGSITMRGDGKVLVKGTSLVSKAQQLNRILGATVTIN